MAKKRINNRSAKKVVEECSDNVLPQNIVAFGEHVQEDKTIYIAQSTYKEIHRFTKDKTTNESGGVLLGNVVEEFGKTHIVIRAFIEAKYSEGTPTTLKFTHETWEYIHNEAEKKYPNYKILGWIHTHPDFGIFLSEYDKFIQENFFKDANQIAYVVDPIQNIEGFYFWINEKIERCKGFYVFDKTGTKITVNPDDDTKVDADSPKSVPLGVSIVIGIMGVIIVALLLLCMSLNVKINTLSTQMQTLVDSANTSLYSMTMQMNSLYSEVDELRNRITELEKESDITEDAAGTEQQAISDSTVVSSDVEGYVEDTSVDAPFVEADDSDGAESSNE